MLPSLLKSSKLLVKFLVHSPLLAVTEISNISYIIYMLQLIVRYRLSSLKNVLALPK